MLENLLQLVDVKVLNKNQQLSVAGGYKGCGDDDAGGGCHTSK